MFQGTMRRGFGLGRCRVGGGGGGGTFHILTPIPGPSRLKQASQICTRYLASADLRIHIETGLYLG